MRPSPASSLLMAATLAAASPPLAQMQHQQNARSPVPGVVQFDIARRHDLQPLSRRATDMASLHNNITNGAYVTTVSVGTPPQTLTLQVDTGSSDTWLPSTQANICQTGGCFYGSYNQAQSSSAVTVVEGAFSIRYGDGTSSQGNYITDDFTIGATTVSNLTMGLALTTDNNYGLVGVGLPGNEAVLQLDPTAEYPNLPVRMVNLGLIPTTAYSLWLNDLDSSTGSLLMGGVDSAKYHGSLQRLRLYPTNGQANVTEFVVALTTVSANSSTGTDALGSQSFPMSVLLDSGSTFTTLPKDLVTAIWAEAGVENTDEAGPIVPCSFATQSKGSFVFGFGGPGGPSIVLFMDELVRTVPGPVGQFTSGPYSGQDACQFMIGPVTEGQAEPILGDSFLRSAYVVYDLENLEVALAPTRFNASDSDVVAFSGRGATVPDSSPAPNQDPASLQSVAVTSTNTGNLAAAKGFLPTSAASTAAVAGKSLVAVVALAAGLVLML